MSDAKATVLVLGRVVKQLRERRGWSQTVLMRALGTGQTNLSRIEAGLMPGVHIVHLRVLARALGLEPHDLMGMVEDALARGAAIAEATLTGDGDGWTRCGRLPVRSGLVGLADYAVAVVLTERFGPAEL